MDITLFASLAMILYLITTGLIINEFNSENASTIKHRSKRRHYLTLAWFAGIFHAASLQTIFSASDGINLGFFNTAALVILIVVLLLITTAITKPIDKLGIIIFPLSAIILLLKQIFPAQTHVLTNLSLGMEIHILVSILAFSLLNIAAVQAILLALQDWQLHHRQSSRFIRSLPPLQTMESLLFQMIAIGFMLLTISLLSGFVFVHDILGQHLAHKTLLSVLAWIVFSVLLWGRICYGWRGQTAIRWTLIGFFSLLLAYFGSKMVLELILKRTG